VGIIIKVTDSIILLNCGHTLQRMEEDSEHNY